MSLNLTHLENANVRSTMRAELDADIAAGSEYLGTQLSPTGQSAWIDLLKQAIAEHDAEWLASAISKPDYWESHYVQNRATGPVRAKVPSDANIKLSNGEFMYYYIRALCVEALKNGENQVRVVRVRESRNPRPESLALEGQLLDASDVLADLKANHYTYKILGVPAGPNSGLAVERV